MTRQEFIRDTKRKRMFQKVFEYLLALLPTVAGLFFLYQVNFTDWLERQPSNNSIGIQGANIFSLVTLLMGLNGIRTVTKNYKIITIGSKLPADLKKEIVKKAAKKLNIRQVDIESNPYFLIKDGGLFGCTQEVRVYIDRWDFLIEVHSTSIGIIDFGYRNRFIKKLKRELIHLQLQNTAKEALAI